MPVELIAKIEQKNDGSFKLVDIADLDTGELNVLMQLVTGGQVMAGSDATAPVGEIVVQRKTTTGVPTHTASEGTLCWNTVDDVLYASLGGGSWSLISGDTDAQALVDVHTGDAVDAHDASAISFIPTGTVGSTDVQAAIAEVASEAGASLPFASPTISLSATAATGSASSVIHSDATIVAFDATNPTTSAVADSATTGIVSKAARRDHGHAREGFGAPSTQAFADTAVTGTATTIPHSDHKHAMPVNPVIVHEAASDPHPGYETAAEAQALIDAALAPSSSRRLITFVWDGTNWVEESRT